MERAIEWFIAVTSIVFGASHLLRPGDWVETYRRIHASGRVGAFINGAIHLFPGAAIVACHRSWAWPGAVLTALGWLMVVKSAVCFLMPEKALRSIEFGIRSPRNFVIAGVMTLAIGAWACFCLWAGR